MEKNYLSYYELSKILNVPTEVIKQALRIFRFIHENERPSKKALLKNICLIVPLKARDKFERGYKQLWNLNIVSQIINTSLIDDKLFV